MGYTVLRGSFVIRYPDLPRQGPQPDGDTVKFPSALVDTLPRRSGRPAQINLPRDLGPAGSHRRVGNPLRQRPPGTRRRHRRDQPITSGEASEWARFACRGTSESPFRDGGLADGQFTRTRKVLTHAGGADWARERLKGSLCQQQMSRYT